MPESTRPSGTKSSDGSLGTSKGKGLTMGHDHKGCEDCRSCDVCKLGDMVGQGTCVSRKDCPVCKECGKYTGDRNPYYDSEMGSDEGPRE